MLICYRHYNFARRKTKDMKKTIKNIVFDMGGVLVDIDRMACVREFQKLGFKNIKDYIGDFKQKDIFLALEEGNATKIDFYDFIKQNFLPQCSDNEIKKAWLAFLITISDYKLRQILRLKTNYRIYLLSNTNPIHFEWVRCSFFEKEGKKLEDFFDFCFLSYELKITKPNEEIFSFMIEKTNINPQETLFIDDGQTNIETASKLGFICYKPTTNTTLEEFFEKDLEKFVDEIKTF